MGRREDLIGAARTRQALTAQGQRPNSGPGSGMPNVRQTERSQRDDPRKPILYGNKAKPPLTQAQKALANNLILREAVKKLLPQ